VTDPDDTVRLPIWKDPGRYGWKPAWILAALLGLVFALSGCAGGWAEAGGLR
jgi:hypothetical protein